MKGIKGFPKGSQHHEWKGDKVSYNALHGWVERALGNKKECDECRTTTAKKFEWANISGEYKRDVSDWRRLCTICHIKFDRRFGEGNGKSKLKSEDVKKMRLLHKEGIYSYEKLRIIFNISKTTVSNVITRRTWRHIDA